jgi:hypothetical protein
VNGATISLSAHVLDWTGQNLTKARTNYTFLRGMDRIEVSSSPRVVAGHGAQYSTAQTR